MTKDDLHAEKLGWRARVEIHLGRCPRCGSKLKPARLPELVEDWAFHFDKTTARTHGRRPAPKMHHTTSASCGFCSQCARWFQGRWTYWKAPA